MMNLLREFFSVVTACTTSHHLHFCHHFAKPIIINTKLLTSYYFICNEPHDALANIITTDSNRNIGPAKRRERPAIDIVVGRRIWWPDRQVDCASTLMCVCLLLVVIIFSFSALLATRFSSEAGHFARKTHCCLHQLLVKKIPDQSSRIPPTCLGMHQVARRACDHHMPRMR